MAAEALDVTVWLCIFQMNNNVFSVWVLAPNVQSRSGCKDHIDHYVRNTWIRVCNDRTYRFNSTPAVYVPLVVVLARIPHHWLMRVWWVSAAEMWAARLRKAVKFRPLTVHSRRKRLRDGDWRSSHTVWFSGRAFADYHPITVTAVYLTSCPVPKIPTSCLTTSDSIFDRKVSKSIFPSVRCCVIKA